MTVSKSRWEKSLDKMAIQPRTFRTIAVVPHASTLNIWAHILLCSPYCYGLEISIFSGLFNRCSQEKRRWLGIFALLVNFCANKIQLHRKAKVTAVSCYSVLSCACRYAVFDCCLEFWMQNSPASFCGVTVAQSPWWPPFDWYSYPFKITNQWLSYLLLLLPILSLKQCMVWAPMLFSPL